MEGYNGRASAVEELFHAKKKFAGLISPRKTGFHARLRTALFPVDFSSRGGGGCDTLFYVDFISAEVLG